MPEQPTFPSRGPWRAARLPLAAVVMASLLTLSACQTPDATEAFKDVASKEPAASSAGLQTTPSVETIGTGAVKIAVLAPRSAAGPAGQDGRDIRDGAALAQRDLGQSYLAVSIYDYGSAPARAAEFLDGAVASGARMVIGPSEPQALAAVGMSKEGAKVPVLSLSGSGSSNRPGLFSFASDEIDSAIAAGGAAASTGRKSVVVVGVVSAPDRVRLEAGLKARGADLAGIVATGGSMDASIRAEENLLGSADAVVVLGRGENPAVIVALLKASRVLGGGAQIFGTSGWPPSALSDRAVDGVLIALIDQASLRQVGTRFEATYGRAMSQVAAQAYDAVAIPAGIARVLGAELLTNATLTKSSGYRGATGQFRLMPDGRVERQFVLYKLGKDGPKRA